MNLRAGTGKPELTSSGVDLPPGGPKGQVLLREKVRDNAVPARYPQNVHKTVVESEQAGFAIRTEELLDKT